jgi:hypothetical protein
MAPSSCLELAFEDFESGMAVSVARERDKIAWSEDDPKVGSMKDQLSCDNIPEAIPGGPDISVDREIIHLDDTFATRVLIDPRSHQ